MKKPLDISVCVCTLNPEPGLFLRVIQGLQNQTLAPDAWELIIVDNHSYFSVEEKFRKDLEWHPNVRFVREEKRGFGFARCRAILESIADILVFVDDDCIVNEHYLSKAKATLFANQEVGVLTGSVSFERPDTGNRFVERMYDAIYNRGKFEGFYSTRESMRYTTAHRGGAGMVVRRCIALQFVELFAFQRTLIDFLRTNCLPQLRYEDMDVIQSALKLGFAIARSGELQLRHVGQNAEMRFFKLMHQSYEIGFNDFLFQMRWQWPSRGKYSLLSVLQHALRLFSKGMCLPTWLVSLTMLLGGYRASLLSFSYGRAQFIQSQHICKACL